MRARSACLPALVLAGCLCSADSTAIDGRLTIARGVYGQTVFTDDVGCEGPFVGPGRLVELRMPHGDVVADTISDGAGFFEIAAAPGSYELCAPMPPRTPCTPIVVPEGPPPRWDLVFGAGPGWTSRAAP